MNILVGDARIIVPGIVVAFATHQDHHEWDAAVGLCTPDFRIAKYGQEWDIPKLRQLWNEWKAAGTIVRQTRLGLAFVSLSEDAAETIGYGLMYTASPTADGSTPELTHPAHLTEYREHFVNTESGWRMSHRTATDIMQHKK